MPTDPPHWRGNLNDDCHARWGGLLLHAEKMDDDDWWWAVSDESIRSWPDSEVASSNHVPHGCITGGEARAAAEWCAREYLKRKAWRFAVRDKQSRRRKKQLDPIARAAFSHSTYRRMRGAPR